MAVSDGVPPRHHASVGDALARLRHERGLSGAELAALVGMSQPKISRIERDVGSPDPRDIETIARALTSDESLVIDLAQRAARAKNRIADWRPTPDSVATRQEIVGEWESTVGIVRELALTVLPGLLQSSGYARAVLRAFEMFFRLGDLPHDEQAIQAAVGARIKRQRILADPAKHLHAVISEYALRSGVCSPAEMLAQIGHLRVMADQPNVDIQIVPDDEAINVLLTHGFTLYGEDLLLIELYNTGLVSRETRDVAFYRDVFDTIAARATYDIVPILDRHERRCLEEIRLALG